ncbi:MAG: VCBS repeat-containing protein [Pseudomonadota bacterium]
MMRKILFVTACLMALALCAGCSCDSGTQEDAGTDLADFVDAWDGSDGFDMPDLIDATDMDAADTADYDESPSGTRCDGDHPCPDGWVCEEGVCMIDCGENERCDGDVCCAEGDVCYLGACMTPGDVCMDPDSESCVTGRCPPGFQCDPTIGRCMPVPEDVDCTYEPGSSFEPVVLWRWTGSSADPTFGQVIATPAVADLDGDGASDIIIPAAEFLPGGFNNDGGILCALSGVGDCEGNPLELWCTSATATRVNVVASPAVADLDGDGELTIIAGALRSGSMGNAYGIAAYTAAGELISDFGTSGGTPVDMFVGVGGPAVADLDGDGIVEVFVGYTVFDNNGLLLWERPGAEGNVSGPITIAADLDGEEGLEIIGGNMAWHADGTEAWAAGTDARGLSDGWPAVADFDADGVPEVVVVSQGAIRVFDNQGNLYSTAGATVPGRGGPPTIADVDGDDTPEIAVAGSNSLTVFNVGTAPDHALAQLWQMESRDFSSNFTGSSVFDFDGDGQAEVIYGDECFARVYDGPGDGMGGTTVRFEVPNTSCTGTEYPVVADVTSDGKAEFIVVANNFYGTASACAPYVQACFDAYPGYEPNNGVAVYRDSNDNWVQTRAVWNQHSYHVTNVCDGEDGVCPPAENTHGAVPTHEPSSWLFPAGSPLNSYRVNARLEGVFNAPDLTPRNARADLSACPVTMGLLANVTNIGAIGVPPGVPVAFFWTDSDPETLIGVDLTSRTLLPGASELVRVDWTPLPSEARGAPVTIEIRVDDDGMGTGVSNECDETNNTAIITPLCSDIL